MTLPKLGYSPKEVAEIAGRDYTVVLAAIGTGALRAKKKGEKRYLVLLRDIEAWLDAMPDA